MAASLLTACGNDKKAKRTADGKANLTVMVYAQEHEQAVYQEMIDAFKEANKDTVNDVDFQVTTADEYGTKIAAAISSNTLPDVFYVGPENVEKYASQGIIAPLKDLIAENDNINLDDIWPAITEAYEYDGDIYALPKDLSTFAYAFNKRLFDEAGLEYPDIENPYTWDEFYDVCKTLTKDKDGDGETDQWGAGFAYAYMFTPFMYSNGATFLNEDQTKVTIDGDENFLEAVEYFASLTLDGLTPSVEQDAALGYYSRWLDGQLGFYAAGTWDVAAFNNDETFPDEWDFCAWPVGKTGVSYTWNGTVGFCVANGTENTAEALDLISYLSVNQEGQEQLSSSGLQIPNTMEYAKSEFKDKVKSGEIAWADNIDVVFNYIEGTEKYQGVFLETTYTYNAEWWDMWCSEFTTVLDGSVSAADYISYIAPKMQTALDEANEAKELNS